MPTLKYEDILDKVGEFGPYQQLVYYLFSLPAAIKALIVMSSIFVLSNPDYRCSLSVFNNETSMHELYHRQYLNLTFSANDDKDPSCHLYVASINNNFTQDRRNSNVTSNETKSCDTWIYDDTEFVHTIVTEYDLVCDRRIMRSHMNMGLFLGSLLGSVCFGIIGDIVGRKIPLFLCVLLQVVTGTSLYFAESLLTVIILRSVQGMSAEMFALSASTAMELVGTKKRTFAGMIVMFFWIGGQFLVLLTAYLTSSWRLLQLIFGLGSLPVLLIIVFLPESPRWLLEKKRYVNAQKIFEKIARSNKKTWSVNDMETIELDKQEKFSVFVLFKTKKYIFRAIVIFFNWFAINFLYYGVTLSLDNLSGNIYINFLLNVIVEALAYSLCYGCLVKMGRKTIHSAFLIGGGITCIAVLFPVVYGTSDSKWTITVMALIGKMCAASCYATLYIITVEVFPTSVRNSALGMANFFENGAGMVSPYVADLGFLQKYCCYSGGYLSKFSKNFLNVWCSVWGSSARRTSSVGVWGCLSSGRTSCMYDSRN